MSDANTDAVAASRPLSGRSIVVTRTAEQSAGLVGPLEALGAEVLLMPVIAIAEADDPAPLDRALEALATYDWVVLTSANGVDFLDARLRAHGLTVARMEGPRVAAVGSATAARLREHGVEPAVVPHEYRAEGLVEALIGVGVGAGTRVLVPRAVEAREVLPDELRALGAIVDVVGLYRLVTAVPPVETVARLARGGVDAVTFASGGTARRFVEVLAGAGLDPLETMRSLTVASIGPVTSDALRDLGRAPDVEAREATAAALVEALVAHYAKGT